MIPEEISSFIKENIVATVCCCEGESPWCFNVFYAFTEVDGVLIFKSSTGSRHSDMLTGNLKVAGTILPVSLNFAALQGIQFEGFVVACNKYYQKDITDIFHHRHPMAADTEGKVWAVHLTTLKLTDNSKGFGYKKSWHRDEVNSEVAQSEN